ncbi:DUF6009 family protein [Streptomyces anulatus]|uniref:DUF6009 family protein n=1 Tax=Streptomyces anulatus TaxID=1892 RepID=UPI0038665C26
MVWLEDTEHPEHPDYVRQVLDKTPRRKNRPRYARDGRMIGCIELGADTEADPDSGLYRRSVFFLLPQACDSDPDSEGVCRVSMSGSQELGVRLPLRRTVRDVERSEPGAASCL